MGIGQQCGYEVVNLDRRDELQNVQCIATGVRTTRHRSYYRAWATSVTDRTVGPSTYGGMPKPGSTYGRNGNLGRNHDGRNWNGAESHFRDSFGAGAVTEAVADTRSASTFNAVLWEIQRELTNEKFGRKKLGSLCCRQWSYVQLFWRNTIPYCDVTDGQLCCSY